MDRIRYLKFIYAFSVPARASVSSVEMQSRDGVELNSKACERALPSEKKKEYEEARGKGWFNGSY